MKTIFAKSGPVENSKHFGIRSVDPIPYDCVLIQLCIISSAPVWGTMEIFTSCHLKRTVFIDVRASQPHTIKLREQLPIHERERIEFCFTSHEPVTGQVDIYMDVQPVHLPWYSRVVDWFKRNW